MMQWIELGFKIGPLIIAAVNGVERIVKGAKGKEKQDAAVELVGEMLHAIEGATSKDILNDAEVQIAVRAAMDAIVNVQNVIAAVKQVKVTVPND